MKFFSLMMAFLVLGLPAMPCADDVPTANAGQVKIEIEKQGSHENDREHNDACSPFCHCTCCAGFSINHFFAASSYLLLFDSKLYTSYLPASILKASYSIWQPPRIS